MNVLPRIEISANLGEKDYDPRAFVDAAVLVEDLGFRTAWFGDHIFPWYHSGRRSAFVWSVMGVALEETMKLKVGPWVTVPIGARYHPAIIAQAAATLDSMYPGRIQLGVGSGEALNETPFWNGRWPKWEERIQRLGEGVRLIRKMWESKKPFKLSGKYFSSDFYFLYTRPKRRIPIYLSAIGKRAAYAAGLYGDGLITICPRNGISMLQEKIIPAYKNGRAKAGRNGLGKIAIELQFSFQKPRDLLRHSWRSLGITRKDSWSFTTPIQVEEKGKGVTVDDLERCIHFCKNWSDVVELIERYKTLGVTEVAISTSCDKILIRTVQRTCLTSSNEQRSKEREDAMLSGKCLCPFDV